MKEKMKFLITMFQDEDGVFIAECPSIPGCVSQGQTIQEARTNIREAITGWVAVMNKRAKQHHAHTTHEVAV